jgi:hypothetical protein
VLFIRGIVLLSLMVLTVPAQTGVVEGTVVCEGTLEPVSGAQITVAGFRAITDSGGHFVIRNAPAGTTSVYAQHRSYFGPAPRGDFTNFAVATVVVKAFEPASVNLTLIPAAGISGSVFDSNDQPMRNAVVGILRVADKLGVRSFNVIDAKISGKRGEYRIYPVPPGEYYVGVAPSTDSHSTTLYPSTTDLSRATRIRVRAAEEVQGIDIRAK